MKTYNVKAVNEFSTWDGIEEVELSPLWHFDYCPKCTGAVQFIKGEALRVRLTCEESDPRAIYDNFYDPVYLDSCLEFFFSFDGGKKFVNVEMNSKGTFLAQYHEFEENVTKRLDEVTVLPSVWANVSESKWSVETSIPLKLIEDVFGVSADVGTEFTANFYKCGDETETVHYLAWCPIDTPYPSFHQPAYFGKLLIVE